MIDLCSGEVLDLVKHYNLGRHLHLYTLDSTYIFPYETVWRLTSEASYHKTPKWYEVKHSKSLIHQYCVTTHSPVICSLVCKLMFDLLNYSWKILNMIGRLTWDTLAVQQYNLLNPSLIKKTPLKNLQAFLFLCLKQWTVRCVASSWDENISMHCDLVLTGIGVSA